MEKYVVAYEIDGEYGFFTAHADDFDHAKEQCYNAYPGCLIFGVHRAK